MIFIHATDSDGCPRLTVARSPKVVSKVRVSEEKCRMWPACCPSSLVYVSKGIPEAYERGSEAHRDCYDELLTA